MSEHRPRVLIVDDDPIVADSIAEFLLSLDYDAVTANGGAEALQTITDAEYAVGGRPPRPFSVLVTDMSMPPQ